MSELLGGLLVPREEMGRKTRKPWRGGKKNQKENYLFILCGVQFK